MMLSRQRRGDKSGSDFRRRIELLGNKRMVGDKEQWNFAGR